MRQPSRLDRLRNRSCHPDNFKIRFGVDDLSQSLPEENMIVNDDKLHTVHSLCVILIVVPRRLIRDLNDDVRTHII